MADDYLSRLTNDEKGALVALVKRTIAEDRYPFSPRIRPLRDILAKLEPPKLLPRHSLRHFVRLRATRTFIVALLALAIPAFAAETQFVPLQDYIAQPGVEKDLAALGYVADRCTALYLVVAKGLMEETDPERQRFKDFAITTAQK